MTDIKINIKAVDTDCSWYGMEAGCDAGCPVLLDGNCELQDTVNKELYREAVSGND